MFAEGCHVKVNDEVNNENISHDHMDRVDDAEIEERHDDEDGQENNQHHEPDDDAEPAEIIRQPVGLGREELGVADPLAERLTLAGRDFVELPGQPGRWMLSRTHFGV